MKKTYLLVALLCTMSFVACNKDEKEGMGKFEATITLDETLPTALTYGTPVRIAGTITSKAVITECFLTAVQKSGNTYTAVGDPQSVTVAAGAFDVLFFPDSKTMTDVEVKLVAGKATSTHYYPITSVSGDWTATYWSNRSAALYADNKVATHDNAPETYPEEGTGAGSDTKSFFSMPGVTIGNEVKHILSLTEMRSVDGLNGSFAFVNVLQNTKENKYIGGQRGFDFSVLKASSLGGGTTGRQCDLYVVNGHGIKDANIDINFTLLAVNGSWAGEKYNAELFTFVDSLFVNVKQDAETTADKMRAYYQIGEIQRKLDNSTLGVETDPTSLSMKTYLRRWTNAGTSATSALTEGYRAGDYILIRTKRGTDEAPVYYYGIMQVVQIYDDSSTFVDGRMDQTLAETLFGKPIYLNIKMQSEF